MPRKKPDDYERVRGSKACSFCSRRKIKCDGCNPCSACQERSQECIYVLGKKRGPPSKQEQQQQRKVLSVDADSQHASVATSSTSGTSSNDDDNGGSDSEQEHASHRPVKRARFDVTLPLPKTTSALPTSALDELATVAYQSRDSSPRRDSTSSEALSTWSSSLLPDHDGSNQRTSISHRELQSLFSLPEQSDTTSYLPSIPDQHNQPSYQPLATSSDALKSSRSDSPISELSEQVIDQLLTIYQSFVHLHWPIIYLPSLSSLRVLADTHPLLFHAVLAVAAGTQDNLDPLSSFWLDASDKDGYLSVSPESSSSYTGPPPVCPPGTAAKLVKYLQQRIQGQYLARTLETVQVLILLSLVEMGGGESSDAHLHATLACAIAIDLGLHRHHSAKRAAQHYRAEEKQRVLWGCYVLDKMLAAALERPMMLRSDDIDVDLPSTEERDEYDIFVNDRSRHFIAATRISTMADVKCRCISSFGAYCDLMMLLERILGQVYSPKARRGRREGQFDDYKQSVVELDAALRAWRYDLPKHLQWNSHDKFDILAETVNGTPSRSELSGSQRKGTTRAAKLNDAGETDNNVPPQVLTMRAWYSACVLLLHRPRLPLDSAAVSRDSTASASNVRAPAQEMAEDSTSDQSDASIPMLSTQPNQVPQAQGFRGGQMKVESAILNIQASSLVRAAATEICELLPKYQATFSVRRIPSSWVYLIFQSAIIHSSFIDTVDSRAADRGGRSRSLQSRGESECLFRQCVRNLEQMALTWRGASHHVATLKRVADSCRITRPSTPILGPVAMIEPPSSSVTTLAIPQSLPSSSATLNAGIDTFGSHAIPSNAAFEQGASLTSPQDLSSIGGLDWSHFWNQMPSSSEDVWLWQQFIDSFGNNLESESCP